MVGLRRFGEALEVEKCFVPALTLKKGKVFEPEWGPYPGLGAGTGNGVATRCYAIAHSVVAIPPAVFQSGIGGT